MRETLKSLGSEKRYTFIARVTAFSFKKGFINNLPLRTILLTRVMFNGKLVTDHIWMNCGRRFYGLLPQVFDWLQFDARVTKYRRKDGSEDYRLSYPTKVSIMHKTLYKKVHVAKKRKKEEK